MNVAVIIATCGDYKWRALARERALPSVEAQTGNESRTWVQPHYPHATVAAARNRAVQEHVASDWLCFLDADDELESGYLDAMFAAYHAALFTPVPHTASPLLVPLVRRVTGDVRTGNPAAVPNRGQWPRVNECVIGTLVSRRLFEQVGGFRDRTDDGTAITMYEDWDLWLRCWDAGAALIYTDAVYREHVNPAGRNTNAHESQQVYDAIWRDHETRIAPVHLEFDEHDQATVVPDEPDIRPS